MKYPLAERFLAPQGEGLYSGTQMAFLRTVGCSVGQGICTHCDTDFSRTIPELGGGVYEPGELVAWAGDCPHVCLTGGEPLDRDLRPLLTAFADAPRAVGLRESPLVHVETSGTRHPAWLDAHSQPRAQGMHAIAADGPNGTLSWKWTKLWVTVSPKPGYLPEMVEHVADEIKVILGGLGDGPGWPTLDDALRWAAAGRLVYVQPRNRHSEVDGDNLREALKAVAAHPQLRLSCQLHKFIRTR